MDRREQISILLSYLGFLFFFPPYIAYFFIAETQFARFHAQQGIYLTFSFLLGLTFFGLLRWFALINPKIISVVYISIGIWIILFILLNIIAAIFAFIGQEWRLPIIGRFIIEA